MSRLGRSQPVQSRPLVIPPPPPPGESAGTAGTGTLAASGTKHATGSVTFTAASAPGGAGSKNTSGTSAVTGTAVRATGPPPATVLTGSWAASFVPPVTPAGVPPPANASLACDLTLNPVRAATADGNWVFAVVAWRQAPGYPPVTFTVGDDAGNWWDPQGAPGGTSDPAGIVRTAVWRAPAARAATLITAAPTGFVLASAILVLEFAGPGIWVQEAATLTGYAASPGSLPALAPGPGAGAVLWLTACAYDLNTAATGVTGAGWAGLPQASVSNGLDHTSDLTIAAAWQAGTAAVTAAWGSSQSCDQAAIVTGVLVSASGPVPVNPAWPITVLEMAAGSGAAAAADEITWTEIDDDGIARFQDLSFSQGAQYELGEIQAGRGAVTYGNPDLALLPPGSGKYSGIDSGTPLRLRMTWPGGGPYPVQSAPHFIAYSGFHERWPQSATSGTRRQVTQATIIDAWAYCQAQLRSAVQHETLADQPTFYWPLGDIAGTTYAANIAPGTGSALVQIPTKYGPGPAAAAFGGSAGILTGVPGGQLVNVALNPGGTLPGDSGTAWTQSGMPGAYTATGYLLYCQDPGLPSMANPMSVDGWFQLTGPALWQDAVLWAVKAVTGPVMALTVSKVTGALQVTTWTPSRARTVTVVDSTRTYVAGAVFHVALTWDPAGGWLCYVDGAEAAGGAAPPNAAPQIAWISAGGQSDRFTAGGCWNGSIVHLAVYPLALPPARVAAHYLAGATGLAAEPAHSRVERLLGYAGYTGRRVIQPPPPGGSLDLAASAADLATQQAGASIGNIVASVPPAMLMVAPSGEVTYIAKARTFGQPPRWLLGDRPDLGEIPYLPDIAWDYDPTRVVNDIQVTQLDRQDVVIPQVAATEAAAVRNYGSVTDQVTGYLYGDLTTPISSPQPAGLLDMANWVAIVNAAPQVRAKTVTIDASSYPAAWPLVLAARCGDMAQVIQRPVTAQPQIAVLARITKVARQFAYGVGQTAGRVQLTLDPAPEAYPLTLGDPVLGQLGGPVLCW